MLSCDQKIVTKIGQRGHQVEEILCRHLPMAKGSMAPLKYLAITGFIACGKGLQIASNFKVCSLWMCTEVE